MVATMTKHSTSLEELDRIDNLNKINELNALYNEIIRIDEAVKEANKDKRKRLHNKRGSIYEKFLPIKLQLNARWSPDDKCFILPKEVMR